MIVIQGPDAGYKFIKNLSNKNLFIYSPTSLASHRILPPKLRFTISTKEVGKIKEDIDTLVEINNDYSDVESVVCFGGGVAIDIAKYISLKINRPLTAIPSVASTNSFATNKVCLISEEATKTMNGHLPDQVIIDMELLSKSDPEMNLCGIAELLSFHTALFDWKIADTDGIEKINPFFYDLGRLSLDRTIHLIKSKKFDIKDPSSIQFIIEGLFLSGFIVNLYGSGRPQSGSEHIFSRKLEDSIKIPHGFSVSLGIIVMSYFQNNDHNKIKIILQNTGLINTAVKRGASPYLVKNMLLSLKPRADRYSILDKVSYKEMELGIKKLSY